jgi:shikimate kinase
VKNIYLTGFMGTGKSSVAAFLSSLTGLETAEMDALIVAQEGRSIAEIFDSEGEEAFRGIESALLRKLAETGGFIVSCGGGVPLREENRKVMKESGTVILLTAPAEELARRLASDTARPLLADKKSEPYIAEMLARRLPYYNDAADLIVETAGKTPSAIAEEIAALLRS